MESKNNDRAIFVLFLTIFIDLLGFGIILPILPLYAEQFGAKHNEGVLLISIYSLMQLIFAPLWGRFSDRYGRRPILLLTLFGSVIAYAGLAFANSLWILFIARSFAGIMSGNITTAQAYIADITTPANRTRGMGIIGAAFGLGFIFGPAIGGLAIGSDPQNAKLYIPLLFPVGLSLFGFLCALMLLPESLNSETKAKIQVHGHRQRRLNLLHLSQRPQFCVLVGINFLVNFAFAGMSSIFPLWSNKELHWGLQQISYIFVFMGIITTIIQGGLIGFLKKRLGEKNLLILGILGLALGLLLIGFSKDLIFLLFATMLVAWGISVSQPILNSLISQTTAPEEQGQILGVAGSCSALGRISGPAWAGVSLIFGSYTPFLSGFLVMLVALTLGLRVTKSAS